MPGLDIAIALPEQRGAIANLMQLYIHDFSDFWAGTAKGDLNDEGRFPEYPLDAYWRDPAHVPLLFRFDDRLIGFALLNASPHGDRPIERNMAEFFIVRKHRRGGLGTLAARTIFSRYPGSWETAVARRNVGALAFWQKAIRHHPAARDIEELDLSTPSWNGPLIRFRIFPLSTPPAPSSRPLHLFPFTLADRGGHPPARPVQLLPRFCRPVLASVALYPPARAIAELFTAQFWLRAAIIVRDRVGAQIAFLISWFARGYSLFRGPHPAKAC